MLVSVQRAAVLSHGAPVAAMDPAFSELGLDAVRGGDEVKVDPKKN